MMNIKLNTICFILLLFLLIGVASAANIDNETLHKTIEDEELNQISSQEKQLESSNKMLTSKSKQKVNIKAPDVKMHYKDGSAFTVTLKDAKKKVIKKAKVKITLDGKTYTKKTNSKGKASINLNLKSGKYSAITKFDETPLYKKANAKSTITIKSTVKCSDLSKYYKNKSKYCSKFYDKKGKILKQTSVKFKLNNNDYTVKTDNKGVGKLAIDLKPGKYSISAINSKTSETIKKAITIKTILETSDLTMNESDGSKFSVKVLNSNGKCSPNKKVTLKINGKTYTPRSNSKGVATQIIDLPEGKYSITTEYEGLKNTNQITVNKGIKHDLFSHITSIPNYVNVTNPYVFHNSVYAIKTGLDGIIRMPKNELFTIRVNETKEYLFSKSAIPGVDSVVIGYKAHLVPFDGSATKSDFNKNNLKGNGILIYSTANHTNIEYRNNAETNDDLFGIYIDKGLGYSETITYLQNNHIKAKVNFYTVQYDELGLKYNLAKFYGKSIYDFNYKSYDEITNHNTDLIKFANTNENATFSYFGKSIVGYPSKEEIITKFIINGEENLEKIEAISYGLNQKYRQSLGFEVLQSYAIINEKITKNILKKWTDRNSEYLSKFGAMNIYGMFLASLETVWLADEIADNYAKEFNVNWKRDNAVTILGGINLDNTYLHILNANMGMTVNGDGQNTKMFRLMNSVYLPNIENYVLAPVGERYIDNITNSIDNILESIEANNFSIVQMGEIFHIICEDGKNSTMIINSTSGVANVILSDGDFAYKGAAVPTTNDCCSVGIIPKDIVKGIRNTMDKVNSGGNNIIKNILNKIHPLIVTASMIGTVTASIASTLVTTSAVLTLSTTVGLMMGIHSAGNYVKNNFVDKKDWHYAYEHITFTRDGYMQNKKFYNIPKNDGTYEYVEVGINSDGSLNRNDALYISKGNVKKLTKEETYQYFSEEYWTPFNVPTKYWDKSWKQ